VESRVLRIPWYLNGNRRMPVNAKERNAAEFLKCEILSPSLKQPWPAGRTVALPGRYERRRRPLVTLFFFQLPMITLNFIHFN